MAIDPLRPPPSDEKAAFERDGYVIVRDLIASPNEFGALAAASQRVIAKTRVGDWPHRRVVGRQFPPYDSDNPDSWGVQHLMHTDLGEKAFAEWYTGDRMARKVCELVGCKEEDLQMGECVRFNRCSK